MCESVRMAATIEGTLRKSIRDIVRNHGYDRLKEEQLLGVEKFVSGSDVFVSLPTGFGKLLIYRLLPPVSNRIKGYTEPTSIALVVILPYGRSEGMVSSMEFKC